MTLKIGDLISDNDPRMPKRLLRITDIRPDGRVQAESAKATVLIASKRIFTDGKARRSGFSLVQRIGVE